MYIDAKGCIINIWFTSGTGDNYGKCYVLDSNLWNLPGKM